MQQFWAMSRQESFYTVIMNQSKNGKVKKPSDLYKLGIDENNKGNKVERKIARVINIGTN